MKIVLFQFKTDLKLTYAHKLVYQFQFINHIYIFKKFKINLFSKKNIFNF